MKHLAVLSLVVSAFGALALETTSVDAYAQGGPIAIPVDPEPSDIIVFRQKICTLTGGNGLCVTNTNVNKCFLTHNGTAWTCSDTAGNTN